MYSLAAHDPVGTFPFDYRGVRTLIRPVGKKKWCYDAPGYGKGCEPTFRGAVVAVKRAIDARPAYGHENPTGSGTALIALVALAAGVGGTYFAMKYFEKHHVTEPGDVLQAKVNLDQVAKGSAGAITYSMSNDKPFGSSTPAFQAGLQQFQVYLNKAITPEKLKQFTIETGITPPALPLRTDGVLDQPTADWLIYSQG
jgi:hypothetical protein